MRAAGVFAGGGFAVSTGTTGVLAGSGAGASGGETALGGGVPRGFAEAALAAAISSTKAGTGGAAEAGRVETSGRGSACVKRSGGGPTATRYGSKGFAPGMEPVARDEVDRGLGVTSDASAGTKRNERHRMILAALTRQVE